MLPPSEKPDQQSRLAAFPAKLAQHCQQVAGQPGVIQGLAQMLRAAAGAHVKTMRRETGPQRRRAQASNIARLARPFQTMHHDDLALAPAPRGRCESTSTCTSGSVRMQPPFDGKLRRDVGPRPEVADDGLQMRIPEERVESEPWPRTYSIGESLVLTFLPSPLRCCLAFAALAADTARPSPPFTILRPGAAPIQLSQYRGKIVALAFIQTTCSHCQQLTTI